MSRSIFCRKLLFHFKRPALYEYESAGRHASLIKAGPTSPHSKTKKGREGQRSKGASDVPSLIAAKP